MNTTAAGEGPVERGVGRLVEKRSRLPADVARCTGYEADGELRDGCEDCRRRTDRSTFPLQVWMAPPLIVAFECEARIAP